MCQGGIYDHLGGGFARYSTDARWLVPHFEKMLYDNAELVDLLTLVWQETRIPLYRQRIDETLGWVIREMRAPGGGFASSLDADSEHEEGKFYVWTAAEIDAVLGGDAPLFKRFYDVTPEGNWEGHTILNRLNSPALADAETEDTLALCRDKLFRAREPRVRPGWDDKVLADWNGLMISAMANAGLVFEQRHWIETARSAFDFARAQMTLPDGRLLHSWRDGRARHPANIDDYANLCRAALALHEATADDLLLAQIRRLGGGARPEVLGRGGRRLFLRGRRYAGADRARQDRRQFSRSGRQWHPRRGIRAARRPDRGRLLPRTVPKRSSRPSPANSRTTSFHWPHCSTTRRCLAEPVQIVLVGEGGDAAFDTLRRSVYGVSLPNRVVLALPPGRELPTGHPAFGKGLVAGRAAAYVCIGTVCSLPLTDAEKLVAELSQTTLMFLLCPEIRNAERCCAP